MRTTLEIDDTVLAAVKEIAETENKTAGAVLSELARKGLSQTGKVATRKSGFPTFAVAAGAKPFTSADVKAEISNERLPARR
jgi:hypothetical protein